MLVLFETPAGLALFKVLKEKRLRKADDVSELFASPDKAAEMCVEVGAAACHCRCTPAPPPPQREAGCLPAL